MPTLFKASSPQKHDPDRELAQQMARGREAAFDEFFDQVFPVVFRYALRRLDDASAAEDVAQITMARVVRSIHTYRAEASLLTWTLTTCRRVLADEWRTRSKKSREVSLTASSYDIGRGHTSHSLRAVLESLSLEHEPLAEHDRTATRQLVRLALDCLPRRQRLAVERRYLMGESVAEVAAGLCVSEKAAESLLSRGRAAFREAFELLDRNLSSPQVQQS